MAVGRLKTRYVRPIQKRAGVAKLERRDLAFFGRCLVKFIQEEARKDAAKSKQIPDTKRFFESFSYQITTSGIEITSDWPFTDMIVNGTDGPFPMTWLTQEEYNKKGQGSDGGRETPGMKVPKPSDKENKPKKILRIPLRADNGDIVIRTAPLTVDKAWIHPGIVKHNFVNRAFDRAREVCFQRWMENNLTQTLAKEQDRQRKR